MFSFALVSLDGDCLGPVTFARDFKEGDLIPQSVDMSLRVV